MVFRLTVLLSLIAVTSLGFEVGEKIGEHQSGIYDPDKTALLYVAAHARPFVIGRESGLYVDVGWHRYVFVYDTFEVHTIALLNLAQSYNPKRHWSADEIKNMKDITGFSTIIEGGIAGVIFKNVMRTNEYVNDKVINKRALAVLTVASIGAAYIGYIIGRKDVIDLDDPRFTKSLSELNTWLPLYALFRNCDKDSLAAINMDEVRRRTIGESCSAVERRVVRQ